MRQSHSSVTFELHYVLGRNVSCWVRLRKGIGSVLMIYYCLPVLFQFRTSKVIYRRYAGLFFSICVDLTDNELVYLESIHLFVEILDHFFHNVCELDLVFNFHKVYLILDEFVLAGELQETSKRVSIQQHTHVTLTQISFSCWAMWGSICSVLLFVGLRSRLS